MAAERRCSVASCAKIDSILNGIFLHPIHDIITLSFDGVIFMKKCSCCGIEKTETEFQKRAASNDGLTASCKLCLKARDAERDKSEARKQAKRAYQKTESGKQAKRAYQKTESGKQAHANAMQKYKERYPMKRVAHVITGNAIRDGLLQKPSICSKCDSSHKIEAHHSDYTKPLSVEWLCESCHKEWHRNNEAK